jgi:tryptophan halogenase
VELSWFFVMEGMGLRPRIYDPLVNATNWEEVMRVMASLRKNVAAEAAASPLHDSFYPATPRTDIAPARGWQRVSTK